MADSTSETIQQRAHRLLKAIATPKSLHTRSGTRRILHPPSLREAEQTGK